MIDPVDRIVRAIALDRAYQMAGGSCSGCGLPAVRRFGNLNPWMACASCVVSPDPADGVSASTDALSIMQAEALPTYRRIYTGPKVRVIGGGLYLHVAAADASVFWSSSQERLPSAVLDHVWVRLVERRDDIVDLPNRKAVELLVGVWRGES